jgi:hypothetical protein
VLKEGTLPASFGKLVSKVANYCLVISWFSVFRLTL